MQEKNVPRDHIGQRVKAFALSKYGSVKGLAEALGKNYANVHKYVSGARTPGLTFLDELKSLGCNIDWVRTGQGEMYAEEKKPSEPVEQPVQDPLNDVLKRIEQIEERIGIGKKVGETVEVPLYSHAICAGDPLTVSGHIEEYIPIPKRLTVHPANTYAVRAIGDSMIRAGIEEGDLLIVDQNAHIKDRCIVIASVDGEQTVKRILLDRGRITLAPENKSYAPIKITESMHFKILGAVLYIIRAVY